MERIGTSIGSRKHPQIGLAGYMQLYMRDINENLIMFQIPGTKSYYEF